MISFAADEKLTSRRLALEGVLLLICLAVAVRLLVAGLNGTAPLCPIGQGCARVLTSPLSSLFGLPISAYGLTTVTMLLVFLMYEWSEGEPPSWPHLILAGFATVVVIVLQSYSVIFLRTICTLCGVFSAALLTSIFLSLRRRRSQLRDGKHHAYVFLTGGALIICAQFLIFPITPNHVITKLAAANRLGIESFLPLNQCVVGSRISPNHLYVFYNPDCQHCMDDLPSLLRKVKESGGRTQMTFCWIARSDLAKEKVAAVSSIPPNSGLEGEILEEVMSRQIQSEAQIRKILDRRGLKTSCLMEPWIPNSVADKVIKENAQAAVELGVQETPAFVAFSSGGTCVELNFRQALDYI